MPKVTEFKVGMTCDGCSSACTRILSKIDGAFLPSLSYRRVRVCGSLWRDER